MTEFTQSPLPPNAESQAVNDQARRATLAPAMGDTALLSSDMVKAFYGAQDHYLGRPLGERGVNSIIKTADGINEVIAKGEEAEDSLAKTLEAMHTLETAITPPIVRFSVNGSKVSFTELQHYAPRIAPSTETYPVPAHLKNVLKDDHQGSETYQRTVEQQGWGRQLFTQVSEYVATDPDIGKLASELGVVSLSALTPEQAVKLSLGVVQSLSKYSWLQESGKTVAGGKREDNMTTMELLAEGKARAQDPFWIGNGVCRNVASNVKAVFEALKGNQGQLSMLNNTYAVYESGSEGFGARKRDDASVMSMDSSGHAWNTFVTVAKNGDSSITTVDATWAMGRNKDGSLKAPDYTAERMFESIAGIANTTDDKLDIALAMSDYLGKFTRIVPGEGKVKREQKAQFALTEWLKIAPIMLEADILHMPSGMIGTASRLGAQLDKSELQTLYKVQEAGWVTNVDAVLDKYVQGKTHLAGGDRFVVQDDGLQKALFDRISDKLVQYADRDVKFRIRVRQIRPDILPQFNPDQNPADKTELSYLMQDAGLFTLGNKPYGDVVRGALLKAAGGQQHVVEAVTGSMSNEEILRQYNTVRSAISRLAKAGE